MTYPLLFGVETSKGLLDRFIAQLVSAPRLCEAI